MTKRRRKYTQEFKEEAVKLVLEHGYKITEAAKNLGVHPNQLGRWKRQIGSIFDVETLPEQTPVSTSD